MQATSSGSRPRPRPPTAERVAAGPGRPAILVVLHPVRLRQELRDADRHRPRTRRDGSRVLEAIELIRPALQSDGGDIVFNGLDDDGVVHVTLVGACGTCPVSMMTLKAGVERIIMDRVPGVTEVVADSESTTNPSPDPTRSVVTRSASRRWSTRSSGDRVALARLLSLVEPGGRRRVRRRRATGAPRPTARGPSGSPARRARGSRRSPTRSCVTSAHDGARVGVLAVDPTQSVQRRRDPRRPRAHAGPRHRPGVFIRSMATRGHLGGLALADAAGGPRARRRRLRRGSSSRRSASARSRSRSPAPPTRRVVVVNPGWGDGVQAAKAGLLEIADVFVVNKADRAGVDATVRDLQAMLELAGARAGARRSLETVATDDRASTSSSTRSAAIGARSRRRATSSARREQRIADEIRAFVLD